MNLRSTLSANMKEGESFFDNMEKVFANLRADHDVATLKLSKKKVEALKMMHVDVTGKVSTLAVKAKQSNGLIQGVRGTGKSHLMLIARDKINEERENICVYINLQEHLSIGGTIVVQERFYVYALLKQLKRQLIYLIEDQDDTDDNSSKKINVKKILSFFKNKDKTEDIESRVTNKLMELEDLITRGEVELRDLIVEKNRVNKDAVVHKASAGGKLTPTKAEIDVKLQEEYKNEERNGEKYKGRLLLDLQSFKTLLLDIISILDLEGITFFYDEWSTLDHYDQDLMSRLIRGLSTAPIFHWIAYIPYKSSLGVLEKSADLPHTIDLDLQFIYEENNNVCNKYFKEFINNRIKFVFNSNNLDASAILRPQILELIVQSSMGNTRDFGVILNKAWENFKSDYLTTQKNRIISKKHVKKAIQSLAEDKLENLKLTASSKYSERLWNQIVDFTKGKSHTHFCIELSDQNIDYLKEKEFEDLLYHRLIHLRKKDYGNKEGGQPRLSIYAVDVSALYFEIFETRSSRKKIKLVTDFATIHNQTRRYIFDLKYYINDFRMEQGKQIQCLNNECNKIITEDMKYAWEQKVCIYCGTPLPQPDAALKVAIS